MATNIVVAIMMAFGIIVLARALGNSGVICPDCRKKFPRHLRFFSEGSSLCTDCIEAKWK